MEIVRAGIRQAWQEWKVEITFRLGRGSHQAYRNILFSKL